MSNMDYLEIGLNTLIYVKSVKGATSEEINNFSMKGMSIRSTQRYLKRMVDCGYLFRVGSIGIGFRYYLSDKSKSLLEDKQ